MGDSLMVKDQRENFLKCERSLDRFIMSVLPKKNQELKKGMQ